MDKLVREVGPWDAVTAAGYLVKKQKGHVFVSKLIRDWWKARFEFQYIPASER